MCPISVVAKAELETAPIIGTLADSIQTVFVSRGNEKARCETLKTISKRIYNFKKFQKEKLSNCRDDSLDPVYPLIIFPEGTTSNGQSLLSFKIGAFNDLSPITIFFL